MPGDMTDSEVVATWMEPRKVPLHDSAITVDGWWVRLCYNVLGFRHEGPWRVRPVIDLDAVWLVVDRLSLNQKCSYLELLTGGGVGFAETLSAEHATAAQKIVALATVLRPIVEAKDANS